MVLVFSSFSIRPASNIDALRAAQELVLLGRIHHFDSSLQKLVAGCEHFCAILLLLCPVPVLHGSQTFQQSWRDTFQQIRKDVVGAEEFFARIILLCLRMA